MFEKILVANRGEIALRIIRACKELGIRTVAVYSEADITSLHVRFADEKICIGPPPPGESYLDPRRIVSAAEITNSDAIHPGYGFLAENPDFAEICLSCNMAFIGPKHDVIRALGDKAYAKKTMKAAGVNVIPGSDGVIDDFKNAEAIAEEIGYPIMIKAVAGGGGRGMRLVMAASDLKKNYESARGEASVAFGNPDVYFERYIAQPRHIEIQILGDLHGNVVHLGERDCTVQRRHQKLIEESPSPVMTAPLREKMGQAAIAGAKAAGYTNAGTFEFLVDSTGNYYFMEANTRIQVEHPVTEEVTGIDLVQEQIKVAAGEKLAFTQQEITFSGHTFECRINAEDPERNFAPAPGRITNYIAPGGHKVRVDSHIYCGYDIPPNYDSLLAKLIVSGKNRQEAINKVLRCLDELVIEGIPTTRDFYKRVFRDSDFVLGLYDNTFVEKFMATGGTESEVKEGQTAKEES
ncbi:MAG TPA: acetyl-CoA carboxylase biotin carboxylase subunit [candidate division Zixibacteria bacterium]|nr:acetyl-CoA carboxylase biotin carboxylase subunit [candidate division Zixibacteria bacterium]